MATTLQEAAANYEIDPKRNSERIELLEYAIRPLIDEHLQWKDINESPSAHIDPKDYGYVPPQYWLEDEDSETDKSLRPTREPLDYRTIAGKVLGIDPESPIFEDSVREIDGFYDFTDGELTGDGWFAFIVKSGLLTKEEALEMIELTHKIGFRISSLTEDNDTAYVRITAGTFATAGQMAGVPTPALQEWYGGLWIAEEDNHKDGQRDYGRIMRLITGMKDIYARNSQIRAGSNATSLTPTHLVIYTPRQELDTKVFHMRNGAGFGPVGHQLQTEEASDESRHFDLYAKLAEAMFKDERFTEEVIMLMYKEYGNFVMPGATGIPRYLERAAKLARAHIYDQRHDMESARAVLRRIGAFDRDDKESYVNPPGLSTMAQAALESLRATYDVEIPEPKSKGIFVLGKTATITALNKLRHEYRQYKGLPDIRNIR